MKKIYRDFNHWWSNSEAHGMSSASKDWMKEIWDDILPTIEATRDDYKNSYIELMKNQIERKTDIQDALLKYIELYKKEDSPLFWRWFVDEWEVIKFNDKVKGYIKND